jgi:hypothetical protein
MKVRSLKRLIIARTDGGYLEAMRGVGDVEDEAVRVVGELGEAAG